MLAACVARPGDSPPEVTEVPRIALNSLSPTWLADGQLTTDALTSTTAAAMGQTQHERKVLAFAVGCALNANQSVTYTVGGIEYTATGGMGMVPGWTSSALSTTEAGWISACLFARLNLSSAIVVISAQGDEIGLETTTEEVADYQVEEGAFWGNAFVDLGSITGYACNGVDQAADDSYGDLPTRECAEWDGVTDSNLTPCGLHYAGLCGSACTSGPPYSGCSFLGGAASSTVVTTYLYGTPE
jgi:hypothetical protein